MGLSGFRGWKAALLLLIVVPVGFLTFFVFDRFLNGSVVVSETTVLETVEWQIERPAYAIGIGDVINASYENGEVSIDSSILIYNFISKPNEYGSTFANMRTSINASVVEGFISFVNVSFWEGYGKSRVSFGNLDEEVREYRVENLSIESWAHGLGKWWLLRADLKGFVTLKGAGQPKRVYFSCFPHWILNSPENFTHRLEVRFELVYFNGTAYKKIVQPFLLKVGPDNNSSFETATELSKNQTFERLYIGGYDKNDCYRIYVDKNENVSINLEETSFLDIANINVHVYDPDQTERINQTLNPPPRSTSLSFTADKTGYWYIQIELRSGQCFYTLTINTTQNGD